MNIQDLFGIALPIVQAPMAGVQAGALAVAVSNAGGLGSLPCALLGRESIEAELEQIRTQSGNDEQYGDRNSRGLAEDEPQPANHLRVAPSDKVRSRQDS